MASCVLLVDWQGGARGVPVPKTDRTLFIRSAPGNHQLLTRCPVSASSGRRRDLEQRDPNPEVQWCPRDEARNAARRPAELLRRAAAAAARSVHAVRLGGAVGALHAAEARRGAGRAQADSRDDARLAVA